MPARLLTSASLVSLAVATCAVGGCGAEPRVARVYDGRVVEGRYIAPDAYDAFLRGALAEESGDLHGAVTAYTQALDEDAEDPEIEGRIGELRCRIDPHDPAVDVAFTKAFQVDPDSASALAADARCETARGRVSQAMTLAQRAASLDPSNVALQAFASRTEAPFGDPAARARAVELTRTHGEHVAAWDALIAWGYARKDAELVAQGLEGLVRVAPTRSNEVEKGALAFAQAGQTALARRLAVAVADAPRTLGVIGPRDQGVARLAVDEALTRADRTAALARATRGHLSLSEVAARALLLEQQALASSVATSVAIADPTASGALMVLAALKPPTVTTSSTSGSLANVTDQPPEICALVFANRVAATSGPDAARVWLARTLRTPMAPHDPLAGPLALDLAARGILPATALPEDLRASASRAHAKE